MNKLKLCIAGKVSKDSSFGTQHWRDDFCAELARLSGLELQNLDPLKQARSLTGPSEIFAACCRLIAVVVYLSDDISVGESQEILIARYLHKPVIGFAPLGGKLNGCRKEMPGRVIEHYRDPFVFSTCDVVCGTLEEVAAALQTVPDIESDGLAIIDRALGAR